MIEDSTTIKGDPCSQWGNTHDVDQTLFLYQSLWVEVLLWKRVEFLCVIDWVRYKKEDAVISFFVGWFLIDKRLSSLVMEAKLDLIVGWTNNFSKLCIPAFLRVWTRVL